MGCTHYMRQPQHCFTPEGFARLRSMVDTLIVCAAHSGIDIESNGDEDTIWFNGVDEEGHEDFVICFESPARDEGFSFCKTAQKPYDAVVVAALIAANICSDGRLVISSDGDLEDWQDGLALFEECYPGGFAEATATREPMRIGSFELVRLSLFPPSIESDLSDEPTSEYLVVRLNYANPTQRLVDKIVCRYSELLDRLNELLESQDEYACDSIEEAIGSYDTGESSLTVIDLTTLDFVS